MIGKKINQLATELAPVSTDLTIIGDPISGVSKKITLAQLGAIFSGAVSFYTNLAGFPATGDINVIYCAKDTQKLYLWSGSAYVEVFPSQALLDTYQLRSEKGVSNGYASLDSAGKVPISQLPSSIMEYKGTWNAATNTPTLANGTGDTGDVYICNVAGTVNFGAGPITFAVGDYVIYSGTIWQRSSGAVGTVTSVAASITGNAIGITGSPVTTSGTLAFAFAGTGAQYIKGDGTLATFPSTIAQAERLITEVYNRTGATLTKGTIVYINGGQGNLPTVTKALATGDSTSAQTFGVVQADITNNNNGYVVVAGKLSDLDTQAYTEGTQLYLSATTAGTWTSTKQYAPNHLVYIGIVVRAHPTQGIVEIKIQNGYELDEIHNVAAQTPTNNDGLFWESATSLWKNKSIATVLGYTPQAQLNGTGFVKASGTSISYDNSTYLTTSAAASTYLPLVLNGSANTVDINGQQFTIQGSAGGFTSGRIIVDPVFSAIGYQNSGVFDGLKILTNGNAEFTNSGVTRFFNQVRFDSTLTNGTYTYTLPGASGTIALVGGAGVGTVTSVGLSSATSGVTIGSTPITTSGTITLAIATASGSQQGLLSSTDWTTFNNKQNALTNPVTGTGTTNYLPKFTGTSTIGNSSIFDNGNVAIGSASPVSIGSYKTLLIQGGSTSQGGLIQLQNSDASVSAYWFSTNTASTLKTVTNHQLIFGTNNTDYLYLSTSGNLGLGVTPSAWSVYRAFQLGTGIAVGGLIGRTDGVNEINFGLNWTYTGGASLTYIASSFATNYYQKEGAHIWQTAPSGTAGNAISFTQAMTLNASGNLSIGNTNDTYKLDVSGTGRFTGNVLISKSTDASVEVNSTSNLSYSAFYHSENGTPKAYWEYINSNFSTASRRNYLEAYNLVGGFAIYTANAKALDIASTGAATFSSSVTANGTVAIKGSNALYLYNTDNTTISAILNGGASGVGDMSFYTGGSQKMIITSSGSVGIGTTSPASALDVNGQTLIRAMNGGALGLVGNDTLNTNWGITWYTTTYTGGVAAIRVARRGASDASDMMFFTSPNGDIPSERMRITSGGNVGIGTTSPSYLLDVNGIGRFSGGYQTPVAIFERNADYGQVITLGRKGVGADAGIGYPADSTLGFYTASTERMRITSGGEVLMNMTSAVGSETLNLTGKISGSAQYGIFFQLNPNTYTSYAARFFNSGSSAVVGSITMGTSSTSYNTSSDYRLKTDFKDFSGLDLVSKIKTYDYEWKSDKSRSYGVIAHELQSVINYAVTGVKDGEQMQGVDYSKIVPVLIKAIQELNDKIK